MSAATVAARPMVHQHRSRSSSVFGGMVPPLALGSRVSVSVSGSASTSTNSSPHSSSSASVHSGRSASSRAVSDPHRKTEPGTDAEYRPRCPRCQHRAGVDRWRMWKERNEMVWHCARYSRDRADMGPNVCAQVWVESARMPRCPKPECDFPLSIEQHFGRFGFACVACKTFGQETA